MRGYPTYKDSEVEWIGRIPASWDIRPLFTLASESKISNKGMIENNLLSLSYGRIIQKDIESLGGLLPESFETYQVVNENDIIFRLTDLQNDKRSLRSAICRERGIITSAYVAVTPKKIRPKFMHYLMRSYDETKVFYNLGSGMRQSLKYDELKRLPLVAPPESDQKQAEDFLDLETARIDNLIAEKKAFINLLKEKRQALISHVVTKGLDPNVKMKDSGIEWIGEVPEHWIVKSYRYACKIYRGKFGHRPRNDPALYDGEYPFIQTGDIARAKRIIESYKQTLNEEGIKVSQKFPAGTLVMAIAANIGVTAILGFEAYAPDSVVGFNPKDDVDLDYLRFSFSAALPALEQTSIQSTQSNLNIDRIAALKAVFPPIEEQKKIVELLDSEIVRIESLLNEVTESIKLLSEHRASLITAVVTGKIDVRNHREKAA